MPHRCNAAEINSICKLLAWLLPAPNHQNPLILGPKSDSQKKKELEFSHKNCQANADKSTLLLVVIEADGYSTYDLIGMTRKSGISHAGRSSLMRFKLNPKDTTSI
jgi:hypothetical protein